MDTPKFHRFKIAEVDSLEIFSLVDNSADFLSTISRKEAQSFRLWTKKRYGTEWTRTHTELPIAEHGLSLLIRILSGGEKVSVLFDTGISSDGVVENAKRMGLKLGEVDYMVLSHGHYDHFGGLVSAVRAIDKVGLRIILHDGMSKKRGNANSSGKVRAYPEFPPQEQLCSAQLISTKKPCQFADKMFLITGEIPRETSFEKGYLRHKALVKGSWQADPWIWDDRAIIFNVKEKGLVVISGCAHAGIINTIAYAQRISGIKKVHMVIGGFHLAGKVNEARISPTVKELKRISPKIIVPSHCTGWRGMFAIAKALPEAFVWNSVGTLYKI